MKKVTYVEVKNDPKYIEVKNIIKQWSEESSKDKNYFDAHGQYTSFYPDVKLIKKIDSDTNFTTAEDRMNVLSGFLHIDGMSYEDNVKMLPENYYKGENYLFGAYTPGGYINLIAPILRYVDKSGEYNFHPSTVLDNLSGTISLSLVNKDMIEANHIYHLINFIKNGDNGQTFGEFKKGRDDLMIVKDGVPVASLEAIKTLYEFNEVAGFYYGDYDRKAETLLAKTAWVLTHKSLGSVRKTTPKEYIKLFNELDLQSWEKLIQTSYDKKIKGIRTVKSLKLFLEDLTKNKKTGVELQDDLNKVVLTRLIEEDANYNASINVMQMIPAEYDLNKIVDIEGVINLTNYIKEEKLSTMEVATLITAISNKSIWVRNSNPSNVYTLLFELVKLDRKGSMDFLEFLIRENVEQVPTAAEIEEFIANYDDEFSFGILGSLSLSLISKNSDYGYIDDGYIGPKIEFLRRQFNNLEESLKG